MSGLPGDQNGYMGFARVVRDYTAVSAACMMCRRNVFEEADGFDESYRVAFNDIDFCLRLRQVGYRIVYTPHAELEHIESTTRGMSGFYHDYQEFLLRWESEIKRGDPLYNKNLSRLDLRCVVRPVDEDRRWEKLLSGLMNSSSR
jgi:GT2 family glycosyltransferase